MATKRTSSRADLRKQPVDTLPTADKGSNSVLETRLGNGKRLTVTSTQRNIKTIARKARKTGSLTDFLPAGSSEDFHQYNGKDLGYLAAQVR